MLRLAADENFNNGIVRGLLHGHPGLDITRVQDRGLSGVDDSRILDWAAGEQRILLTHDASTVPHYAFSRIVAGERMPGVFLVKPSAPKREVIEDILLLVQCSIEGEWEGQVLYLPLK